MSELPVVRDNMGLESSYYAVCQGALVFIWHGVNKVSQLGNRAQIPNAIHTNQPLMFEPLT